MSAARGVEIRLAEGEALLAGRRVPIAMDGRGLRLPETGGLRLRPLTFGERGRLARAVLDGQNAGRAMAAAVLRLSVGEGRLPETGRREAEVLALHLAGAGSGAPGFAEEMGLLSRWLAWSAVQIEAADAAEIDAVAKAFALARRAEGSGEGGWVSLQLDEPTRGGGAASGSRIEDLRDELAADLLRRARALPDLEALRTAPLPRVPSDAAAFDGAAAGGSAGPPGSDEGADGARGGEDRQVAAVDPAAASGEGAAVAEAAPGPRAASPAAVAADSPYTRFPVLEIPRGGRSPASELAPGRRSPSALAAASPPGGARSSVPAPPAWTPVADFARPPDVLTPDRLAIVYPAIFGALHGAEGAGWNVGGQLDPVRPAPDAWDGDFDAPPLEDPRLSGNVGAGRETPAMIVRGPGAAATAAEPTVDEVARALHRIADLRGVAP